MVTFPKSIYIRPSYPYDMKRKVVRHGSATLTVSLPSKWAKRNNINKGDELEVVDSGTEIIIKSKKEPELKKAFIDVEKLGAFTRNHLHTLYHLGYDEIEIRFKSEEDLKIIQQELINCIGFEIISQNERSCLIKSISDTLHKEYDTILRKVFQTFLLMIDNMIDAIEKKEMQRFREIRHMEQMNNRLTGFCLRVLNKHGYSEPGKTSSAYILVEGLEELADNYKHISNHINENNVKIGKETLNLFKNIREHFDSFYKLYYKFDKDLVLKLLKENNSLRENACSMFKSGKGDELLVVHYLLSSIDKMYELINVYFEMVL